MKKYTISIETGLQAIAKRLNEEGHKIVPYDQAGLKADVVIISGVDSAYEEMETAEFRPGFNGKEVLLINASGLSPDAVIKHIEQHTFEFSE